MVLFIYWHLKLAVEHSSYVFYSLLLSLGSADSWKFCFTSSLYLFHFCICLCHNRVHCRRAVFDYTLSRVHVCWINTGRWELRTIRFLQCIFVATLRLRVVMIVTVVGCTVGGEHTLFCYLSFFFAFQQCTEACLHAHWIPLCVW